MKAIQIIGLIFLFNLNLSAQSSTLRDWTSIHGSTIEAEFSSYENGQVNLVKKSGDKISLPLNILIKADRDLIEKLGNSPNTALDPNDPDSKYKSLTSLTSLQLWSTSQGKSFSAEYLGEHDDYHIFKTIDDKIIKTTSNFLSKSTLQDIAKNSGSSGKQVTQTTSQKTDPKKIVSVKQKEEDPDAQKDVDGITIKIPYELGSTTSVKSYEDLEMKIYTPNTLRSGERYGVIIFIEPKNGAHKYLDALKQAADENELIVLTMPEKKHFNRGNSRSGSQSYEQKRAASINEIFLAKYALEGLKQLESDFAIDSKRVFTAGYRDTNYIAMWAMSFIGARGCLAINGGGKDIVQIPGGSHIMFMCNPSTKERWDLATTLDTLKSKSRVNVHYYNSSSFPNEDELSKAIYMMHSSFMLNFRAGAYELAAQRFENNLIDFLESLTSNSIQEVYPWLEILEGKKLMDPKNEEKLKKVRIDFLKDLDAVKSINGKRDLTNILLKYFDKGWRGYEKKIKKSIINNTSSMAKKYEGTIWEDYLKNLLTEHHKTNKP